MTPRHVIRPVSAADPDNGFKAVCSGSAKISCDRKEDKRPQCFQGPLTTRIKRENVWPVTCEPPGFASTPDNDCVPRPDLQGRFPSLQHLSVTAQTPGRQYSSLVSGRRLFSLASSPAPRPVHGRSLATANVDLLPALTWLLCGRTGRRHTVETTTKLWILEARTTVQQMSCRRFGCSSASVAQ